MEIRYECTADDYADAQVAHSKSLALYYAFLVVGVLALVMGIALLPKRGLAVSAPEFIMGAGFILWTLVFLPLHAKRDFKKQPHMAGTKLVRADDEGLALESDLGKSENKWSLFTKFRETPRVFMLYVGARNFMIIPKRALSAVEQDQFRALVLRKIQSK